MTTTLTNPLPRINLASLSSSTRYGFSELHMRPEGRDHHRAAVAVVAGIVYVLQAGRDVVDRVRAFAREEPGFFAAEIARREDEARRQTELIARQREPRLRDIGIGDRDARQQRARVRMLGILEQAFPAARATPLVTVLDGHPHTLSFLATVNGVPHAALGVAQFGQSGAIEDLYRYNGIDTDSIIRAALDLVP